MFSAKAEHLQNKNRHHISEIELSSMLDMKMKPNFSHHK